MGIIQRKKAILLNEPHVETASGSVANFYADMAAKLASCVAEFSPEQSGSGDPSPSNVRPITGWTGLNIYRSGTDTSNPTTFPVSWASKGTVYGGYVDPVTGELVATYKAVDLGSLTYTLFNNTTNRQAWQTDSVTDLYPVETTSQIVEALSPIFKPVSNGATWTAYMMSGYYNEAPHRMFFMFPTSAYSDGTQVQAALSGIPLVYILENPIIYQLDAQRIKTMSGINNIWSNANDTVTVKYWTHIYDDVPPEYQRVEYIRAKTNAYIATNYIPTQGDEFEVTYMADLIDSSYRCLMSAGTGTYQLILLGNKGTPGGTTCQFYFYKYFASGNAQSFQSRVQQGQWNTLTINKNGLAVIGNYSSVSPYEHALDGNNTTLYIFRRRNSENAYIGKLKSFRAHNNGTDKLNLIPCIRKSDGKAGVYDTVSRSFYSSSGTEEFTPSTLDN